MKWWQNHSDVITISVIWHKIRKKKEDLKETMALAVATDGKNDKTEFFLLGILHNKRTQDGTCVLFCVPPSFVLNN